MLRGRGGNASGTSDVEQTRVVEQFAQEKEAVRILVATEVASEGLNLHYLSHRLVHVDIPWSLMTLQQRNGRIDRYGQSQQPLIRYLLSCSSVAGFGVAYVDLPKVGRVRPFLGAGLGVARNSLSSVTYSFPGIAANAATVTPDGSSSDLAYRFSDLGDVRTSRGQAGLSRPTLPAGTTIPIGGTTAALQAHGVQLSLRYSF
ncbi:outer membrane protein [Cyanobium sp. WKJ7-Wakatipu]|uniref:outer membrane protein n=1 Tax=Cyanobium sp. WKJ7-Wakatipu TaxID=2823726 RepID=UPI0020CD09D7|nr:C-terminal helicase domain-containing protein [Cyanobium sp. WKJ7-Wakatipu]